MRPTDPPVNSSHPQRGKGLVLPLSGVLPVGIIPPVTAAMMDSGAATSGWAPLADGSGAVVWQAIPTQQAYSAVQEEGGASLTQRSILNFVGAGVTATDDGSSKTVVTVPGETPRTSYEAACSGNTTITATSSLGTDITGATVTLAVAGVYLVLGVFDCYASANGFATGFGELQLAGAAESEQAIFYQASIRETVSQVWVVTTGGANVVAKLSMYKEIAAGTLIVNQTHSKIVAVRLS